MGDSISAAYGIDRARGWVNLLAERLASQSDYHIVNASISGETTAGGLARLPATLAKYRPELVVIELGGNDGLRGYPLASIQENLKRMVRLCQHNDAKVLLVAMQIPPNYGPVYSRGFLKIFTEVGQATGAAVSKFVLDGVGGQKRLMQQDGIHPTAEAQAILLANIWPRLQGLLGDGN